MLYKQSRSNIKHVLHISRNPAVGAADGPEIVKVEAYDGSRHNSNLKLFNWRRPRLAARTAKLIGKHHCAEPRRPGRQRCYNDIFAAELNNEEFRNSQGRELVYDAIRISAEDKEEIGSQGGRPDLRNGDGETQAGGERDFLDVSPLSLIVDQLVDPLITNPRRLSDTLSITRRSFSLTRGACADNA